MPGEDQYLCNEQWHKVSELFAISSQLLMFKEFHSPSIYRYPGYEWQNEQVSKRITAVWTVRLHVACAPQVVGVFAQSSPTAKLEWKTTTKKFPPTAVGTQTRAVPLAWGIRNISSLWTSPSLLGKGGQHFCRRKMRAWAGNLWQGHTASLWQRETFPQCTADALSA